MKPYPICSLESPRTAALPRAAVTLQLGGTAGWDASAGRPLLAFSRYALMATAVAAAITAALFADASIVSQIRSLRLPGELRRAINVAEAFAHGAGVVMILLAIAAVVRQGRRRLWLVAACAFGSGLAADLIKLLIPRLRPSAYEVLPTHAWETFIGPGSPPLLTQASLSAIVQSFPSGHTATAFGLATGLTWFFGRGRAVFLLLAGLASLQRLYCGAHWPSDVAAAAAVGMLLPVLLIGRFGGSAGDEGAAANDSAAC